MLIVILAAAWTIIHLILGIADITATDYWGIALPILFVIALIVAFVRFAQERTALQAASSTERFPEPAISKFFLGSDGSSEMWFVVRMYVGAEWLLAGWEKITSPAWGTSGKALAGFVAGALAKTSGPNPAVQGWYATFLKDIVLPNAGLFPFLVTRGEFAVG
jgi:thiosulfate dehydrogenase [quinone] large subunit